MFCKTRGQLRKGLHYECMTYAENKKPLHAQKIFIAIFELPRRDLLQFQHDFQTKMGLLLGRRNMGDHVHLYSDVNTIQSAYYALSLWGRLCLKAG